MIKMEELFADRELNWFLSKDKEMIFEHFSSLTFNPLTPSSRFIHYANSNNRALIVGSVDTFKPPSEDIERVHNTLVAPTIHHRLGAYLCCKLAQHHGFDMLLGDRVAGTIGTTLSAFNSDKRYNFVCELGRAGSVSSTIGCENRALSRALDTCGIGHNKFRTMSSLDNTELAGNPGMFQLALGYDKPYSSDCVVELMFTLEQIDKLLNFKHVFGKVPFVRRLATSGYGSGYTGSTCSYHNRNTYVYKPKPKDYTVYSCGCGAMYCAHEMGDDKKCLVCDLVTTDINDKIMEVEA